MMPCVPLKRLANSVDAALFALKCKNWYMQELEYGNKTN